MYTKYMNDGQFDKLFTYLQRIDTRLQHVEDVMASKDDIRDLQGAVAELGLRFDDEKDEQVMRDTQWKRLATWTETISKKNSIPAPEI